MRIPPSMCLPFNTDEDSVLVGDNPSMPVGSNSAAPFSYRRPLYFLVVKCSAQTIMSALHQRKVPSGTVVLRVMNCSSSGMTSWKAHCSVAPARGLRPGGIHPPQRRWPAQLCQHRCRDSYTFAPLGGRNKKIGSKILRLFVLVWLFCREVRNRR